MDKQLKLDITFMNMAKEVAKLSYCQRHKVGALIVREGNISSFGYNGTPSGMDNCCEDTQYVSTDAYSWIDEETISIKWPLIDENGKRYRLITKKETLHAESNAILKAAKSGVSTDNSTLYITLSPCIDCAKLILQSGIKRVVYSEEYKDVSGIEFLRKFISIEKLEYEVQHSN
jgi:dCMP deaminase